MNNKKKSKSFILNFTGFTILLLLLVGLATYWIDPFFRYRVKDKEYILNPIYVNAGLIKNYKFNTAIIGSSMVQNYDLDILRQKYPEMNPLKLASGAMTVTELEQIYNAIDKDSVNTFIINIDMVQFNEWFQKSKYPSYLFSSNFLDQLRYHFAYESTIRYGFTDLVLSNVLKFKPYDEMPDKLKYKITIDDIGNFKYDAIYNSPDYVKDMFMTRANLNFPNLHEMEDRIANNIDKFFEVLDIENNPQKEYIFVLPPYSVLYWRITQIDNYYQKLMDGIIEFTRRASEYPNVRVQLYYTLPQITDMNSYSDVSHFDPEISNFILENLDNEQYRTDSTLIKTDILALDSIIKDFIEVNNWAK